MYQKNQNLAKILQINMILIISRKLNDETIFL